MPELPADRLEQEETAEQQRRQAGRIACCPSVSPKLVTSTPETYTELVVTQSTERPIHHTP
jgi:hypothetical protein